MVTFKKSWSGGPVLTVSAVKETWQPHHVGCLCLLEKEGEEENEKRIRRKRRKYKQLCTSGEELNIEGTFIFLTDVAQQHSTDPCVARF